MFSIFDILALVLLIASTSLYIKRSATQNPPLFPYLLIAITSLVAYLMGESGGGLFALTLLIMASFSFLGCLFHPEWRNMGQSLDEAPASEADSA